MANHMRKQVLSMRGQPVDFGALAMANAEKRALGNANMNAKGDLLDNKGMVIKTQEQIAQEWATKRARQTTVTTLAGIKDDFVIPQDTPQVEPTVDTPPLKSADLAPESFPTIQELIDSGSIPVPNPKSKPNE